MTLPLKVVIDRLGPACMYISQYKISVVCLILIHNLVCSAFYVYLMAYLLWLCTYCPGSFGQSKIVNVLDVTIELS